MSQDVYAVIIVCDGISSDSVVVTKKTYAVIGIVGDDIFDNVIEIAVI